ncbi:hypothetical protein ScPMuIL_016914 [Solemya velum]
MYLPVRFKLWCAVLVLFAIYLFGESKPIGNEDDTGNDVPDDARKDTADDEGECVLRCDNVCRTPREMCDGEVQCADSTDEMASMCLDLGSTNVQPAARGLEKSECGSKEVWRKKEFWRDVEVWKEERSLEERWNFGDGEAFRGKGCITPSDMCSSLGSDTTHEDDVNEPGDTVEDTATDDEGECVLRCDDVCITPREMCDGEIHCADLTDEMMSSCLSLGSANVQPADDDSCGQELVSCPHGCFHVDVYCHDRVQACTTDALYPSEQCTLLMKCDMDLSACPVNEEYEDYDDFEDPCYHTCYNGRCVPETSLCNGVNDCEDDVNSDEKMSYCLGTANMPTIAEDGCNDTSVECEDSCLHRDYVCSKIERCKTGIYFEDPSDEYECSVLLECKKIDSQCSNTPHNDEDGELQSDCFRCQNEVCLEAAALCNGVNDCNDDGDTDEVIGNCIGTINMPAFARVTHQVMDTGDIPSNINDLITTEVKNAVNNVQRELLTNITTLMDSRLSALQSNIKQSQHDASRSQIAKIEQTLSLTDNYVFKRKGIENQFKHESKVLLKLTEANATLEDTELSFEAVQSAKTKIIEGMNLITDRQKLIKLADSSELGWRVVSEYVANPIADDSDDEKKIFRAQARAERKAKSEKTKNNRQSRRMVPYTNTTKSTAPNKDDAPTWRPGRCFICGKRAHWANDCPDKKKISLENSVIANTQSDILVNQYIDSSRSTFEQYYRSVFLLPDTFFSKLLREVIKYLRTNGTRVIMFLDDGLGGDSNFVSSLQTSTEVRHLLNKLGFLIAHEKCQWLPKQIIDWVGYTWNTETGKIHVKACRIEKAENTIRNLCAEISNGKLLLKARFLASVIGQLISMQIVLGDKVRLHTRYLYESLLRRASWDAPVKISQEAFTELLYWDGSCRKINDRGIDISKVSAGGNFVSDFDIFCDASDVGFGGYFSTQTGVVIEETSGNWTQPEKQESSTWRELECVRRTTDVPNATLGKYIDVSWNESNFFFILADCDYLLGFLLCGDICVTMNYYCNRVQDCEGNSGFLPNDCKQLQLCDLANNQCPVQHPDNDDPCYHTCYNGRCVPETSLCNGVNDCEDDVNSDEKMSYCLGTANMPTIGEDGCNDASVECGDSCLNLDYFCNKIERCNTGNFFEDPSDEYECSVLLECKTIASQCPNTPHNDEDESDCFWCQNDVCLEATALCNGVKDCNDDGDTDEVMDNCIGTINMPDFPDCGNSLGVLPCEDFCVNMNYYCNRVQDCKENSSFLSNDCKQLQRCDLANNQCPVQNPDNNEVGNCFHRCGNGECIQESSMCDGIGDCGDTTNSDELIGNCKTTVNMPSSENGVCKTGYLLEKCFDTCPTINYVCKSASYCEEIGENMDGNEMSNLCMMLNECRINLTTCSNMGNSIHEGWTPLDETCIHRCDNGECVAEVVMCRDVNGCDETALSTGMMADCEDDHTGGLATLAPDDASTGCTGDHVECGGQCMELTAICEKLGACGEGHSNSYYDCGVLQSCVVDRNLCPAMDDGMHGGGRGPDCYHQCSDGECVPESAMCDSVDDCNDYLRSDEMLSNCKGSPKVPDPVGDECEENFTVCGELCIDTAFLCTVQTLCADDIGEYADNCDMISGCHEESDVCERAGELDFDPSQYGTGSKYVGMDAGLFLAVWVATKFCV